MGPNLKPLLLAVLLLLPASAIAEGEVRYYDVELIVFENLTERDRGAESWPTDLSLEAPEVYVELDRPFAGPLPASYNRRYTFKPLAASKLRLKTEARLLEKSKRYRVLTHLAWRQPGMARKQALPVRIDIPVAAPAPAASASSDPASNQVAVALEAEEAPRNHRLHGFVRLVLARYLHFEADLAYQAEPRPETAALPEGSMLFDATATLDPIFHLRQTRRMRSKQLHYLDNPVLGILVLATPFEPGAGGAKAPPKR